MIEELLKVNIGNLIKERNDVKLWKKYELTSEVIEYKGHTLHRIKALKNFGSGKEYERVVRYVESILADEQKVTNHPAKDIKNK